MARDIAAAASRLSIASDYELEMLVRRDADMIRDVAKAYVEDTKRRQDALDKQLTPEKCGEV